MDADSAKPRHIRRRQDVVMDVYSAAIHVWLLMKGKIVPG